MKEQKTHQNINSFQQIIVNSDLFAWALGKPVNGPVSNTYKNNLVQILLGKMQNPQITIWKLHLSPL